MIKRLCLALAGLFCVVSLAYGAGTVPGFSLTPQFDLSGKVAPGCKLFVIQAGTTATPQVAYQDTALTIPAAGGSTLTCDAAGRLAQWFVADGLIKLRLTDKNGVQLFVGDNLTVVGASTGGGGGGGSVDPTTIAATGDLKAAWGTSVLAGWVRANGRTIGSPTSGATERANSDVQALFQFLWADTSLTVGGGRGASPAADWAANKTITTPDLRGRVLAGLDDMGNAAAGRLTSSYFGSTATVLGAIGGGESQTLTLAQIPSHNHGVTDPGHTHSMSGGNGTPWMGGSGSSSQGGSTFAMNPGSINTATTGISIQNNGGGGAHPIVQPTILSTYYLKL